MPSQPLHPSEEFLNDAKGLLRLWSEEEKDVESLKKQLTSLEHRFQASSKDPWPSYAQRQAMQLMKDIQSVQQMYVMKNRTKFKFTAVPKPTPPAAPVVKASDSVPVSLPNLEETNDRIVVLSQLDPTLSPHVPKRSKVEHKDITITNCNNLHLYLLAPLATVRLSQLNQVTIVISAVSGSVFVSDCENCTFYVACHQFRVHDCKNVTFYSHVTSRMIFERCRAMHVAPLNETTLQYAHWQEDLKQAQLALERNHWHEPQDFDWLFDATPSPHWNVLAEEERQKIDLNLIYVNAN